MYRENLFVRRCLATATLVFSLAFVPLYANDTEQRPAAVKRAADEDFATLGFENDIFFRTDRHYSSGLRLSYTSKEGKPLWGLGKIARLLPFVSKTDRLRSQHNISHYIFTPDDIEIADPPRDDRPYAGLLAFETALLAQSDDHLDIFGVSIGVTGGPSLAGNSQIALHSLLPSSPRPEGWSTQVGFEVTAQLRYDRLFFLGDYTSEALQWDFQPRFGFDVGTAFINSSIGGQLRLGNRLYKEPGTALNRPGKPGADWYAIPDKGQVDFYAFIGADTRAVGRNFALDGGLGSYDRAVERSDFVTDISGGFVVTTHYARLSFTAVRRDREFATQLKPDWYGGLYVSFPF